MLATAKLMPCEILFVGQARTWTRQRRCAKDYRVRLAIDTKRLSRTVDISAHRDHAGQRSGQPRHSVVFSSSDDQHTRRSRPIDGGTERWFMFDSGDTEAQIDDVHP